MLERRRKNKHYDIVAGEEPADDEERDVELGTVRDQETGSVPIGANGPTTQADAGAKKTDVTEELDNWDENEEDWDDGARTSSGDDQKTPTSSAEDGGDSKKRTD